MGNSLTIRKRRVKVMKLNGDVMKYKTPIQVGAVLKDYPTGYVVLESEAVKELGIRAKPLGPWQELKPKRLYFLVELPPVDHTAAAAPVNRAPETRRVRSVIHMSAKDRLETLMLSRRSASDLMVVRHRDRQAPPPEEGGGGDGTATATGAGMRVKVWLPKAEVEKLMRESNNETEAAEKIAGLYAAKKKLVSGGGGGCHVGKTENAAADGGHSRHVRWKD